MELNLYGAGLSRSITMISMYFMQNYLVSKKPEILARKIKFNL